MKKLVWIAALALAGCPSRPRPVDAGVSAPSGPRPVVEASHHGDAAHAQKLVGEVDVSARIDVLPGRAPEEDWYALAPSSGTVTVSAT